MKRLFIATPVQADHRFAEIIEMMKKNLSSSGEINWTKLHQIHFTLKFLGETKPQQIDPIIASIQTLAQNHHSFEFYATSIGIFGSSYQPKIIFAKLDPKEEFQKIFDDLKLMLEKIGIQYDRQNFVPHITLGRIKKMTDRNRLHQFVSDYSKTHFTKQHADRIILYESLLLPTGAEYRIEHESLFCKNS